MNNFAVTLKGINWIHKKILQRIEKNGSLGANSRTQEKEKDLKGEV